MSAPESLSSDDSSGFLEMTDASQSYEKPQAHSHNYADCLPPPIPLMPKSSLDDEYPHSHQGLL